MMKFIHFIIEASAKRRVESRSCGFAVYSVDFSSLQKLKVRIKARSHGRKRA